MCGVAGIFSTKRVSSDVIRLMIEALHHRGPDATGYFTEEQVALGHNRLSIIDLDSRSDQPFHSRNNRFVIVYNGEIYNYRSIAKELKMSGVDLRTTSDTEVLIEAFARWGTGFIHKTNGMFACAIYDKYENKLFLFRDRVGKKPLYYSLIDGEFVFASELKAILKHPAILRVLRINKRSLSSFLQLGYIQQPDTFFDGIYKFPAGHYAIVDAKLNFSLFPYWNLTHYLTTERQYSKRDSFSNLKAIVTDAVESRLIADVPVGIFLSGGIDSSLVAAVAAKSSALKSFSIGFKEQKFDESMLAEQIAKHIGTQHYRHILEEKEAVGLLEIYLEHFDEPFADTSAIPTMLVSKIAQSEIGVALTGDGGDELFLGYGSYTWATRLSNPLLKTFRPLIFTMLKRMPQSRLRRVSHFFEKVHPNKMRRHIFSQEQYFFSDNEVGEKLLKDDTYFFDWPYDDARCLSLLSQAERQALFDFQFYLRDDLLVKVDRASMLYGLECRSPLLDYRLAEFAINLPEHYRKRGFITKYILRKMLYELVPAQFFDRPKWGFSIPLAKWLKGDLQYLMDFISPEKLIQTGVFNIDYVSNLRKRFLRGDVYLYHRLWVLIIAQRFLLKYGKW